MLGSMEAFEWVTQGSDAWTLDLQAGGILVAQACHSPYPWLLTVTHTGLMVCHAEYESRSEACRAGVVAYQRAVRIRSKPEDVRNL